MTAPKPFVFVVMPFSPLWNDAYELGIKPACEAAGAECARVDEQIFLETILDRIYAQIERADLVIAEMTGRNPNVYYEAGFAHGLAKPVILLTNSAEDIPFDLRQYPHVVHGGSITSLKRDLEKRVRWCIESPELAKAGLRHHLSARANPGTMRAAGSEPKRGGTESLERLSPPTVLVDSKHCPTCGGYISFATVLASLVYRFKCPHCRSSLAYEAGRNVHVLSVLGYAVSAFAAFGLATDSRVAVFLLPCLFFAVEILATVYVRGRVRLVERGKR